MPSQNDQRYMEDSSVLMDTKKSDKERIDMAGKMIPRYGHEGLDVVIRLLTSENTFQQPDQAKLRLISIAGSTFTPKTAQACLEVTANRNFSTPVRQAAKSAVSLIIQRLSDKAEEPIQADLALKRLEVVAGTGGFREVNGARAAVTEIIKDLAGEVDLMDAVKGRRLGGLLAAQTAHSSGSPGFR